MSIYNEWIMIRLLLIAGMLWTSIAAAGETVRVASAVSLKEAATEIAKAYETDTGNHVEFTFGASGQLEAQIKSGAPIDAFISAAGVQMDELEKAGLIDAATRRDVAGNRLVLVVPPGVASPPRDFKALARVKRLAIGEPKIVPAGRYAQEVLKKLGIADAVRGRLVYGANVRQVLDYVERGEVDAGIVYATDAKEAGDKAKVVATAGDSLHEPIRYPAAVVKDSPRAAAARRFIEYLTRDRAIQVLESHGFSAGERSPRRPAS